MTIRCVAVGTGHHEDVERAAVDVSVIIPTFQSPTVERCVAAVLDGHGGHSVEVLVAASGHRGSTPPRFDDPRVHVLWRDGRWPAAAARNAAAVLARGANLVFVDADAIVDPGWLDPLVACSEGGRRIVAGAVRNGTPTNWWGSVEYLVQFLDLSPRRPAASASHGATCNLLVPRALWKSYGPLPEDLDGGEDTLVTLRADADGRFAFTAGGAVTHLNRDTARTVLAHQRDFGRFTARLSRACPELPYGWLQRRALLAPVAVIARLVSVASRGLAWRPVSVGRLVSLSPGVVVALVAWGAGLAAESSRLRRAERRRGGVRRR